MKIRHTLGCLAGLLLMGLAPSLLALTPKTDDTAPQPPVLSLDPQQVQAAIAVAGDDPRRYAVGVDINQGLNAGLWTSSPETQTWALEIASEGALSLSLQLSGVSLPAGAQLSLSDVQGEVVHVLTPQADGRLWTPPVPGPRARLQLQLPHQTPPDTPQLLIAKAYHGDRALYAPKALGDASSCNVDVACPSGDAWRDEIRAALMLTVDVSNGRIRCSGTLANNSAFDNRPYVLTARHCQINNDNAASVTLIFNFENPNCGMDAPTLSANQVLSGSIVRAESAMADVLLIESTDADAATKLAAFDAYFAGWDARADAIPQGGVALHHPSSDAKKISSFNQPSTKASQTFLSSSGDFSAETWRIVWCEGVTEPGSSGSGLLSEKRRVTGVLSGGSSRCSSPTEPDFFGRLDVAWSESAALRSHLDPAGGGANQTLCGRDSIDSQCPGSDPCTGIISEENTETVIPSCNFSPPTSQSSSSDSGGGGGAADPRLLLLLLACALAGTRLRRAPTAG
jgi:lysyl endopeptidase